MVAMVIQETSLLFYLMSKGIDELSGIQQRSRASLMNDELHFVMWNCADIFSSRNFLEVPSSNSMQYNGDEVLYALL